MAEDKGIQPEEIYVCDKCSDEKEAAERKAPLYGWGRFFAAFEVILGYIGLGGLISILANKVARRA